MMIWKYLGKKRKKKQFQTRILCRKTFWNQMTSLRVYLWICHGMEAVFSHRLQLKDVFLQFYLSFFPMFCLVACIKPTSPEFWGSSFVSEAEDLNFWGFSVKISRSVVKSEETEPRNTKRICELQRFTKLMILKNSHVQWEHELVFHGSRAEHASKCNFAQEKHIVSIIDGFYLKTPGLLNTLRS